MSEWFFVYLAYGVTWVTLMGYGVYLARRSATARAAWRRTGAHKGGDR